jgi:hypothetical protein
MFGRRVHREHPISRYPARTPNFFLARLILHLTDAKGQTLSDKMLEGKFVLGDGKSD